MVDIESFCATWKQYSNDRLILGLTYSLMKSMFTGLNSFPHPSARNIRKSKKAKKYFSKPGRNGDIRNITIIEQGNYNENIECYCELNMKET